jgi:hypothetical protein
MTLQNTLKNRTLNITPETIKLISNIVMSGTDLIIKPGKYRFSGKYKKILSEIYISTPIVEHYKNNWLKQFFQSVRRCR